MKTILSIIKYALTFLLVLGFLFSLLVLATLVPREAIKENMLESAEYMRDGSEYFQIVDFIKASRIDHYADTITLSIAYYLDANNPVKSSMLASYYRKESGQMNEFLAEGILQGLPENQEYIRYWHGSAAVIRFLHLFWNIKTIYIIHATLMAGLYFRLLILLFKKGMLPEAIAFSLSMIAVSVWYVPLCLEYTWMFLVMFVATVLSLCLAEKNFGIFFLMIGMIAAYLDFLTTETLTLLIPLLFILRIRSRQGIGGNWAITVKSSITWGVGFVGMWASKWVLASVILGENVMPYVTGHIDERLSGYLGVPLENYITVAIARNLKCLFPYEYGISGAVLVFAFIIVVVIIPVARNKVTIREKINKQIIPLYLLIALVPFIRFAVLRNHSYAHRFFTHRALASTVLALCFVVLELVQLNPRKAVMKNA